MMYGNAFRIFLFFYPSRFLHFYLLSENNPRIQISAFKKTRDFGAQYQYLRFLIIVPLLLISTHFNRLSDKQTLKFESEI